MIAKVLDKDTSLAGKIWMLFREQGIMIASILTAISMTISVLAEILIPGDGVREEVSLCQRMKNV